MSGAGRLLRTEGYLSALPDDVPGSGQPETYEELASSWGTAAL